MSAVPHSPLPPQFAHDLRTPLNQIIGYAELLQEQAQDGGSGEIAEDLRKIGVAAQQMLALVNDGVPHEATGDAPDVAAPAAPASTGGAGSASEEDAPARILVVDDNETNRDVLGRRLERQGYVVASAEDGLAALERVAAEPFDLVLLDIMMPRLDGYETLGRLKADEATRDLPVIMISALDEIESVVRCVELGAEDYLPKPFNATLLKARIGASLEKKRARDREKRLFDQLRENFEQLERLEKQRDDLTHMIVHDLRTPLSSLMMGVQSVEMMGDLNEDQREVLAIAVGGSQTLLDMINGLLDVNKMESASMTLDYSALDARELLANAAGSVEGLAEKGRIDLLQDVETDLPRFDGDADILRRTLVNLVGNAIKFTPPGGSVTLAARRGDRPGTIRFSVVDTGEGMPPEAASYIFEKFGQVESRKGGRTMSTGLGLTFCRLAVEAHGGEIDVRSALGQGSEFFFWIPAGRADAAG